MTFQKIFVAFLLVNILGFLSPIAADDTPAYVGKYSDTIEDIKAIESVVEDFERSIVEKNGALLQGLFLHDDIFFQSAAPQRMIDRVREKRDPEFMKKHSIGAAKGFVKFISESKVMIEERFYNVKITQDADFALVVFDYDFRMDGKVSNYGIETWQMFKVDGKWRIASVVWSATRPPKSK